MGLWGARAVGPKTRAGAEPPFPGNRSLSQLERALGRYFGTTQIGLLKAVDLNG